MRKTYKVEMVIALLNSLGRFEKLKVISESNLTDKERDVLIYRYVNGKSQKECEELLQMEHDSFAKLQRRATEHFYDFNLA